MDTKAGFKSSEAWAGAALIAAMYEGLGPDLSWRTITVYGIMAALVAVYTVCRTFAKGNPPE